MQELGYSAVDCTRSRGYFPTVMPKDSPIDEMAWGMEGMGGMFGGAEVQEYLREIQARAASDRVGDIRSRMKGLTYGVYPNLSFLWSNTSFKVSHPRAVLARWNTGPGRWCLRRRQTT